MTGVFRSVGIVFLALIGLASTLLSLMAGSHAYGALSTAWQSIGIEGLIAISIAAYACSAAVLWNIRRSQGRGFSMLRGFWLLAVLPFAFFLLVLMARFVHGGD